MSTSGMVHQLYGSTVLNRLVGMIVKGRELYGGGGGGGGGGGEYNYGSYTMAVS